MTCACGGEIRQDATGRWYQAGSAYICAAIGGGANPWHCMVSPAEGHKPTGEQE